MKSIQELKNLLVRSCAWIDLSRNTTWHRLTGMNITSGSYMVNPNLLFNGPPFSGSCIPVVFRDLYPDSVLVPDKPLPEPSLYDQVIDPLSKMIQVEDWMGFCTKLYKGISRL